MVAKESSEKSAALAQHAVACSCEILLTLEPTSYNTLFMAKRPNKAL